MYEELRFLELGFVHTRPQFGARRGPSVSWDSVGWRAGVCCRLLLRIGFGKEGYLQLIRATFKKGGCVRMKVSDSLTATWTEQSEGGSLMNHAAARAHALPRLHAVCCWAVLPAVAGPGATHRTGLGPGGPAQTPVRCQTGPSPADQWGWTHSRCRGANSAQ